MDRVAVVGGGLAGLVAARHLADAGLDVELFEARDEVGGRVRTDHADGFTLDLGFQVLLTAFPAVQRELDLRSLDLRAFTPGGTLVRPGERTTLSDPLRSPGDAFASLVNRDVRQVHDNLTELEELGLIELEKEGRSKRPRVWYDSIEVDLPLLDSETDSETADA